MTHIDTTTLPDLACAVCGRTIEPDDDDAVWVADAWCGRCVNDGTIWACEGCGEPADGPWCDDCAGQCRTCYELWPGDEPVEACPACGGTDLHQAAALTCYACDRTLTAFERRATEGDPRPWCALCDSNHDLRECADCGDPVEGSRHHTCAA